MRVLHTSLFLLGTISGIKATAVDKRQSQGACLTFIVAYNLDDLDIATDVLDAGVWPEMDMQSIPSLIAMID
jgi:hypothetical protein